ncbi:alpha/beta fold hydrolase [Actinophytocola oryzae]|uniref:Pimeloyl-ACP methyl ester carboxylesterase n=1 Tax=Actinophytocola oryzae TaxID=502181 RepID=A0A4R7VN18_9PSEU|nr:alpha/beta hydrolase [Actinophytocola oryzae]TDV51030.1 pimeloyl-ACP methyl ester carboxylesterase [Actinophytocola oryzae]
MGTVTSRDGTVIGFHTVGQGPPLVLVHGTAADHTRWLPVLDQLAEQYTVHAVDRRGRGLSGDGPDYDIRREGEDLAAVIGAAGKDVYVVGHSYGALCSLEAALLTNAVNRILLYEPPAATPGHQVSSPALLAALREAGSPEEIVTVLFRDALSMSDEQLSALRGTPVWLARLAAAPTVPREFATVEDFDIAASRFAGIRAPVRLLVGTESPAYFRPAAEALATQLRDVEVLDLPGQAHVAMDSAPDLFLDRVLGFMR